MTNILEWNIRSMQANREELQILLSDFDPEVVCIQETQMKPNSNVSFKNYCIYHCPGTEKNGTFYGGAAILIKNSISIAHKAIDISSPLQAIAVRATLFKSITICSLYSNIPNGLKAISMTSSLNFLPQYFYLVILMLRAMTGAALVTTARVRLLVTCSWSVTFLS